MFINMSMVYGATFMWRLMTYVTFNTSGVQHSKFWILTGHINCCCSCLICLSFTRRFYQSAGFYFVADIAIFSKLGGGLLKAHLVLKYCYFEEF